MRLSIASPTSVEGGAYVRQQAFQAHHACWVPDEPRVQAYAHHLAHARPLALHCICGMVRLVYWPVRLPCIAYDCITRVTGPIYQSNHAT